MLRKYFRILISKYLYFFVNQQVCMLYNMLNVLTYFYLILMTLPDLSTTMTLSNPMIGQLVNCCCNAGTETFVSDILITTFSVCPLSIFFLYSRPNISNATRLRCVVIKDLTIYSVVWFLSPATFGFCST